MPLLLGLHFPLLVNTIVILLSGSGWLFLLVLLLLPISNDRKITVCIKFLKLIELDGTKT